MSIVSASQEQFVPALWYIVLSAVCDSLDGMMARLTNSASEFGVELDSLADVVGFGVAPSYLVYALVLHSFGTLGILVSVTPLVMGALRLARFNVQLVGFSKDHFTGMPIPLSALTLVSYVLFFGPEAIRADSTLQYVLIGLTAACGALMISTVPYPVVPKPTPRSFREQPVKMTVFTLAALVAVLSRGEYLFPVLLVLIVSGPMFSAGRKVRRVVRARGDDRDHRSSTETHTEDDGEHDTSAKPTIDSST